MKQGFNFLKPQVEPPSAWSKIYEWVVGTARIILIIAEVSIVLALIARVAVDIQAKYLDDQITQLNALMKVREGEEQKYRLLQEKVEGFSTIWTNTELYNEIIKELNKELPPSATELDIAINGSRIAISGQALNAELNSMEANLKQSPLFTKTTLSMLETGNNGGEIMDGYADFSFDLTIANLTKRELTPPQ